MVRRYQYGFTLAAMLGLAQWFYGNLYEAIVLSPNWIQNSEVQMHRLNDFFTRTGPTLYFVPLTQIATALVWVLWFGNDRPELGRNYRRAGVFAFAVYACKRHRSHHCGSESVWVGVPDAFGVITRLLYCLDCAECIEMHPGSNDGGLPVWGA